MNGFRKFLKTVPMKLYIILAAVIVYAFFSNDFGLVDIQKTAVIIAAGVDKTEDGYALTAQISIPKGSDRTTGGTSSVEITTKGNTVSDCVSLIFAETGWVPKLVFCNLILLSEDLVRTEDAFDALNYFMRNEYMNDSCMVAVCQGSAEKLLSSQSALDDASSLAIAKIFSDASEKTGQVMPNTLKDFAVEYYGVSKSGYLPYVRAKAQESDHNAKSGGSSGGSAGSEAEQEEMVYTADETALFSKGKMVGLLTREETFAFSLLNGKVFSGTIEAKDGDRPVTLTVLKNDGGVSLDMRGAPKAKLEVGLTFRLCCRSASAPMTDVAADKVPPEILDNAKEVVTGYMEKLWDTCKQTGCDLFLLKQQLYRSSLKRYADWKDSLLEIVEAEIKAETKTTE